MSSLLLANRKAAQPSRTRASVVGCSAQAWREAATSLRGHLGGYRPALLGITRPIFGGSMPEVDT